MLRSFHSVFFEVKMSHHRELTCKFRRRVGYGSGRMFLEILSHRDRGLLLSCLSTFRLLNRKISNRQSLAPLNGVHAVPLLVLTLGEAIQDAYKIIISNLPISMCSCIIYRCPKQKV